jgi:predicted nucleic acid-binding protein
MAREVFIDAGAWAALANRRDAYHPAAMLASARIMRRRPLVTTNLVVGEAYVLTRQRVGHAAAMLFLTTIHSAVQLDVVYSTAELQAEAEVLLHQYVDHDFSLADAVSFVVMRRRNIQEAFAFDRHFLTAGFTLVPALATP